MSFHHYAIVSLYSSKTPTKNYMFKVFSHRKHGDLFGSVNHSIIRYYTCYRIHKRKPKPITLYWFFISLEQ